MCDLLGMSCKLATTPKHSIKAFMEFSEENKDGWGFAFFQDEKFRLFKEPTKAKASDLANYIISDSNITTKRPKQQIALTKMISLLLLILRPFFHMKTSPVTGIRFWDFIFFRLPLYLA